MNGVGAQHQNRLASMGPWVVARSFVNSEAVDVAC